MIINRIKSLFIYLTFPEYIDLIHENKTAETKVRKVNLGKQGRAGIGEAGRSEVTTPRRQGSPGSKLPRNLSPLSQNLKVNRMRVNL